MTTGQENPIPGTGSARQLTMLVVDDDAINLHLIKTLLVRNNYKVDLARDGAAAVEMFRNNTYDVILMDIMMPVMDGVTATVEIRKIESVRKKEDEVPVIIVAVTANSYEEDRAGFFRAGMDYYMSKPFQIDDLKKLLETHF